MGNTLGCTAGAHGNSRAWGPAQRGCPAGGATGSSTPKGAAFQSLCAALAACKRLRRASIVRRLLRSFRPLPTACALRLRAISGRGGVAPNGGVFPEAPQGPEEILRSESPEHSGALLIFGADNC